MKSKLIQDATAQATADKPVVLLKYREFIHLYKPCRIGEIFPAPAGMIIFQHEITFTPTASDLKIYRSWRKGKEVSTGYDGVGKANVADIGGGASNEFWFILNGRSTSIDLETVPKRYLENRETLNRTDTPIIRRAIEEIFGPRIRDFKPHVKNEWTCRGSGLFTLGEGLVPLPKKYIPKGWYSLIR